jgi:hypothetical protein
MGLTKSISSISSPGPDSLAMDIAHGPKSISSISSWVLASNIEVGGLYLVAFCNPLLFCFSFIHNISICYTIKYKIKNSYFWHTFLIEKNKHFNCYSQQII